MSTPSQPSQDFIFELSANGEQTTFQEVEGISTEVALRHVVKPGENPFKYRLPSLPKAQNLTLKNGQANAKLQQWCADCANPEAPTEKTKAVLRLKDRQGNALVEWNLHGAHPINNSTSAAAKNQPAVMDHLELKYSFYTLSKK